VRVDGDSRLPVGDRQDDVGRLATDAGELEQLVHGLRHSTTEPFDERTARPDEVASLHVEETATLDEVLDLALMCAGERLWRRKSFEQGGRHHVDPRIRALRR